jgi:hypothetical protein
MARLVASDLTDALLQRSVSTAHLDELDDWIEAQASAEGVAPADIAVPLTTRAKLVCMYRLGVIVCRAMAGQNQRTMGQDQDVYVVKGKMYATDLRDALQNLSAADWTGVADVAAAPGISIELDRG